MHENSKARLGAGPCRHQQHTQKEETAEEEEEEEKKKKRRKKKMRADFCQGHTWGASSCMFSLPFAFSLSRRDLDCPLGPS